MKAVWGFIAGRRNAASGDDGSVLILAMMFMLMMASMVLVPLGLADTNVRATVSLRHDRALQTAASAAFDQMVANFRTTAGQADGTIGQGLQQFLLANNPKYYCPNSTWTPFSNPSNSGETLSWTTGGEVDQVKIACVAVVPGGITAGSLGRDVMFTVSCVAAPTAADCPTNPLLLRAEATFYDKPGVATPTVTVTAYSVNF
jgi:hypothetical protein